MRVYIAGGWLGNLRAFWERISMGAHLAGVKERQIIVEPQVVEDAMRIFLAGGNNKEKILEGNNMKVYLAGEHSIKNGKSANWGADGLNILESYYYARKNDWVERLIKQIPKDRFMLDSGAFTFMTNKKNIVDWEKYTEDYAEYINKNNINLFVEMDIDSIVGLKQVEKLRERLENLTGKKSIPVWHRNRSKQYYLDMCKEYDYVALGGMVSGEITKDDIRYFPWFIQEAHKQGTKIHALGFTGLSNLKKYNFDSVDSTAWLYGNRGGFLYHFNGETLVKIDKPEGTRLKSREVAVHNFNEWVKFGKYMEGHHFGNKKGR